MPELDLNDPHAIQEFLDARLTSPQDKFNAAMAISVIEQKINGMGDVSEQMYTTAIETVKRLNLNLPEIFPNASFE